MRFFYTNIYKNLIWIYLCSLVCFSYITLMDAIPDHVYLEAGNSLSLSQQIPVRLSVCESSAQTMAEAGLSTYANIQERKSIMDGSMLDVGSHEVMCYLFGVVPIKEVEVSVVESTKVYPSGRVIGIYGVTKGVFVLGTSPVETADGSYVDPAEHILYPGDYIVMVNHQKIDQKEELIDAIQSNGDSPLVLTLLRGKEQIQVSVNAVASKDKDTQYLTYRIGVWVKDDMAGIGTLTYYDAEGNFGALGHGISDGETGELLCMEKGWLYQADVLGVKKGKRGDPGELQGVVYYGTSNQLGSIEYNTNKGIYGKLNHKFINKKNVEQEEYMLAFKQDIQTGDAVILSDASGEPAVYHIVIDSFDYSPTDCNKGIRFHVDDENLLELTGGIVQGLSGSPIIQNGKMVGAVTHVLINDPTRGYGIFIENMLEK